MRICVSKSKNSITLYVIKSVYANKKHSSKIVERLGSPDEIKKKYPNCDPYEWAKEYARNLTKAEQINRREILVKFSPVKQIEKADVQLYNGGYLFLQSIFHDLGLHALCQEIKKHRRFSFDLSGILAYLIYGRILHPSSKLETYKFSQTMLEPSKFDLSPYLSFFRSIG
jgi:hypothetical protein